MTIPEQPNSNPAQTTTAWPEWLSPYAAQAERAWQQAHDFDEAVAAFLALTTGTHDDTFALVQFAVTYFWHEVAWTQFAGGARGWITVYDEPDPQRRLVEQLLLAALLNYDGPRKPVWVHLAVLRAIYEADGDLDRGWQLFQTDRGDRYSGLPEDASGLVQWAVDDLVWRARPRERITAEVSGATEPTVRCWLPNMAHRAMRKRLQPEDVSEAVRTATCAWRI